MSALVNSSDISLYESTPLLVTLIPFHPFACYFATIFLRLDNFLSFFYEVYTSGLLIFCELIFAY